MKVILGMCTYSKDQENIAKRLKIPVVCKSSDFNNDLEIFNFLFENTNRKCTEWDDVVVLINNCTITSNFQNEVTKFFSTNKPINILDVTPSNIYKKIDYRTIELINDVLRVNMDIINRFDVKMYRHYIYNMVGGINIQQTFDYKLENVIFSLFNKSLEYIDKTTLGAYISNPKLDKMVTTLNKNVKKTTYPEVLINDLESGIQIYKKLDV